MIIDSRLLQTYGKPFDRDGLLFEVDVTYASNIGDLYEFLTTCDGVHLFMVTESEDTTFRMEKKVILKFRNHRDAVEAKLRLEY